MNMVMFSLVVKHSLEVQWFGIALQTVHSRYRFIVPAVWGACLPEGCVPYSYANIAVQWK